jgi:hypothetical protein
MNTYGASSEMMRHHLTEPFSSSNTAVEPAQATCFTRSFCTSDESRKRRQGGVSDHAHKVQLATRAVGSYSGSSARMGAYGETQGQGW